MPLHRFWQDVTRPLLEEPGCALPQLRRCHTVEGTASGNRDDASVRPPWGTAPTGPLGDLFWEASPCAIG